MRAKGIDISKYQAPEDLSKPHGIDFNKMLSKVDFLVVRAGYAGSAGGAWTDERVHEYMGEIFTKLLANPIPFTFYWYFRDDVNVMDQVNRFAAVVNAYKDVINMPLVVDAEVFVKSDEVSTQKIIDFQTEVERQTGLLVDILYARSWQLNDETTPGLEKVLPIIWIARYENDDPQEGQPWNIPPDNPMLKPRDYENWTFWQHTSKGNAADYGVNAGSVNIDENVYNGDVEEVRAFAGLHKPNDPPPDWDDFGRTKAAKVVGDLGSQGTGIAVFKYGAFTPQTVTISANKTVKFEVNIFTNGIQTPIKRGSVYGDSFTSIDLQDYSLGEGDEFVVFVINPSDLSPIDYKVKLLYKEYPV